MHEHAVVRALEVGDEEDQAAGMWRDTAPTHARAVVRLRARADGSPDGRCGVRAKDFTVISWIYLDHQRGAAYE